MLRWLSVVPFGLIVLACGSGQSSPSANPNCTTGSSCTACANCYELCVCATGDTNKCKPACGVTGTGGATGSGGGYPIGGSGGGNTGGAGNTSSGGSGGTVPTGDLATGISISQIDFFQGTKVPMMQNGTDVGNKPAPVVQDRDGMFRVYVTPDGSFQPRNIVAHIDIGGSAPGSFEATLGVGGPSNENDPNSTINVAVAGANVKGDSTYTVSLHEETPGTTFPGNPGAAQYPASGAAQLGAQSLNGVFNVMLVPIVVNGIMPDTSSNRVQAYHDRMLQMYPVPDVNIQVHAPVTYTGSPPQALSTSGWNQLLNWLMNVHAGDGAPANFFYYGVFTPTQSFDQFCGGACIAGLSSTPTDQPNDVLGRTGSGLGFFPSGGNPTSPDTMAHEVGHTTGLLHAPCQTQDYDPAYPYQGAIIGVWGWDLLSKGFLNPQQYVDIMSYCQPNWVADWTYNKMFKRISYVNSTADLVAPTDPERAPGKFETAIIEDDGKLSWGTTIDSKYPIYAAEKQVELLDANGKVVGSVKGFYYPLDHSSGGMLLVRQEVLSTQPNVASMKPVGSAFFLPLL